MRLVCIGDIHGRTCWKKIDIDRFDKIVFIGDYCDSYDVKPASIITNLRAIIDLKARLPDKVVLILGNHDIQYSEYPRYRCSGFNELFQEEYSSVFGEARDLFQVAWQTGTFLFTHAGVSNGFAKNNLHPHVGSIEAHEINVAELLNHIHQSPEQRILHTVSSFRGGIEPYGGITWADYRETCDDYLTGYHQVVGHTPRHQITRCGDTDSSITYIDVLATGEWFHELNLPD